MKCRDCTFLSDRTFFGSDKEYGSVRCTLGLWDQGMHQQWYSFGQSQLNQGPVKRLGATCTQGVDKHGRK
jgi:hypothetical protein